MAIEIKYTTYFEKQIKHLSKKYPSIYSDLKLLSYEIELNPESGVSLGKNFYKIRMALSAKGRGKSGGARVITYVLIKEDTVYLAAIYDKSEYSTIDTSRLLKIIQANFMP